MFINFQYTENLQPESFFNYIHQMKKRAPQKEFIIAPGNDGSCSCSKCPFMELNTMEKLLHCLENNTPSIYMNSVLMKSAKKPLIKMLEMS